jgi:uncharacterized protein YndB with AHSA1/START domain
MSETIRKEMVFPQPREEVWEAIADSALLAEWMFPNDFQPRVGHRFIFQVPGNPKVNFDGLTVQCEVLECNPPSQLTFTWSALDLVGTQVKFRLEPDPAGTRLFFEHAGFDISTPRGKQAFHGAAHGWTGMLTKLTTTLVGKSAARTQE